MAKRFKQIYKKNIQMIIKNGKSKIGRILKKFEDAVHYQKSIQILKQEKIRGD